MMNSTEIAELRALVAKWCEEEKRCESAKHDTINPTHYVGYNARGKSFAHCIDDLELIIDKAEDKPGDALVSVKVAKEIALKRLNDLVYCAPEQLNGKVNLIMSDMLKGIGAGEVMDTIKQLFEPTENNPAGTVPPDAEPIDDSEVPF